MKFLIPERDKPAIDGKIRFHTHIAGIFGCEHVGNFCSSTLPPDWTVLFLRGGF